jgi:hypothetical protein
MCPKNWPAAPRRRASALRAAASSPPIHPPVTRGGGAPVDDRRDVAGLAGLDVSEAPYPSQREPRGLEQPGQPPDQPGIMHAGGDPGVHACLQRVGRADGHAGGGVVAVEDGQPAARAQHPSGLPQGPLGLGHMAPSGVEDHHVEGPVRKLERPSVPLQELHVGGRVVPAGAGQEGGGGIEADDLGHVGPAGQLAGDRAGTAADLQHPGAGGKLDVAQVGPAHGGLLRVGGS